MNNVRLPEYSSDDEMNQEVTKKVKKKRSTKKWIFEKHFNTTSEAQIHIENERTWAVSSVKETSKGSQTYFRCKQGRFRKAECPAAIYLLHHINSQQVSMYRTDNGHEHEELERTKLGLTLQAKLDVDELFSHGNTNPSTIMAGLRKKGILEPTKIQLYNYLATVRKRNGGCSEPIPGYVMSPIDSVEPVPEYDRQVSEDDVTPGFTHLDHEMKFEPDPQILLNMKVSAPKPPCGSACTDTDNYLTGDTTNLEEIMDERYNIVDQCDPDCNTCREFILRLSDHIRKAHSRFQSSVNLHTNTSTEKPSDMETFAPVPQIPNKSLQRTPSLNLKMQEIVVPDIREASAFTSPSAVVLPGQYYSSIIANMKCEVVDDVMGVQDPLNDNLSSTKPKPDDENPGSDSFSLTQATPTFNCEICKFGYSTQLQLNTHSRIHMTKQGSYLCVPCNIEFPTSRYFDRHMKTIHVDKQSIKYETCEKTLKCVDTLKNHEIKHTLGNKPGSLVALRGTHSGMRPDK